MALTLVSCRTPGGSKVAGMNTVLNICEAPYFADPTGTEDCTEAILRALDDSARKVLRAYKQGLAEVEALPSKGRHKHPDSAESYRLNGVAHLVSTVRIPYVPVIYIPEGNYLVSDTLCYRIKELVNTYGSELNQQIRIRGAGVNRTVIRLQDKAAGFGKGKRKPVISFMPARQTNVATSNYCEDLTINCGRGNPGAVGLDFYANNSGAVRNVRITSEDGLGFAGLQLGHSNYSGILIKHVEVKGFDHGLHIDSGSGGMFAHAEDITTQGQRISGVTVGAISLSLRKLRTKNVPAALTCTSPVGYTVLLDSELSGTGPVGIDRKAGSLYVSNVTLKGFADARSIDQWVYPRAFGKTGPMARLTIEDTPIYRGHKKTITGVRRFGALGNGVHDDSGAIQAALDSGAAEIYFEPGRYLLNSPVSIPPGVEHINFNFCDLVAGLDLGRSDREGFIIAGGRDINTCGPPLFVERLLAWEQWKGTHCTFTHASKRTVCFKDIQTQTLKLYRNTVTGGKVFFDNVATTTGVSPGVNGHKRCPVSLKGQKAWARQLNPERGEPMILNDGSDLVLMGYKSEGMGIIVHTINGGRTEVLGGVVNIGRTGDTAFVAENSEMRIATATHGWHSRAYYRKAIRHTRGKKTITIKAEDLPSRGFDKSRGPQYVIPLYKGASSTDGG
jgi:hypothetical protein